MNGASIPNLSLRSPPHYGRRTVWAALAALALLGLSFCIDEAASNQLAPSEMPAAWTRYLAGVALYYAIICAYRWLRRRPMASKSP